MKVSSKSKKFLWIGNSPALDFVNTEIVRNGEAVDLLESAGDFLLWLQEAEVLPYGLAPPIQHLEEGLAYARKYRAEVRRAIDQLRIRGSVPDAVLSHTNRILAQCTRTLLLTRRNGRFEMHDDWSFTTPWCYCAPMAEDLARILSENRLHRIRKCSNEACVLTFYDTSKSGTRRWCSLDLCGNKMRVKEFRARRNAATNP